MSSRGQKVTHARPTPCVGNRTLSRPLQPKGATSTGANQGEIVILPDQIPWGPVDARGAQVAVVVGDPSKPGLYMVYNK